MHAWFFLMGLVFWSTDTERRLEQLPVWFAIMFSGVLLHELGHAFMARRFGMAPRIELQGLGGLTWWKPGKDLSASRRLLVSAAGPAVGISLGLAVLAVRPYVAAAPDSLGDYELQSSTCGA